MQAPPPAAMHVLTRLRSEGHEAWLVGGCVRDRLIGRPVNDWDVATNALPEAVMAAFPRAIPTGLQHGTVTVVHEHEPIEVTTYRVEVGYSNGRHPDAVHFTRELKDDLSRRDFTVNAMAWDPIDQRIEDPFGGQADLEARRLRAVGAALDRFGEDGLRALRAVRFATVLDLNIDPDTLAAIPQTLETFRKVSAERVQVEFAKTLGSPRAAWGLRCLRESGLLGEFMPEVAGLPAETFAQLCAALTPPPEAFEGRLAVLLHASGGRVEPLERLRFSNALVRAVGHLLDLRDVEGPAARSDYQVRALAARIGREAIDVFLEYRRAWEGPDAWETLSGQLDQSGARSLPHSSRELPIGGREVMAALALKPSRRLGRILDALLHRVWREPSLNSAEALLEALPEIAREVPES